MKNDLNNMMDDLLAKYLLGEASETEMKEVREWINNNSNNKKHYDDLKLLWDNSQAIAVKSTVDVNLAWDKFKNKAANKTIPIASNNQYNWLKIAALFLLLLGSGTILLLSRKNEQNVAIVNPISPKNTTTETFDSVRKNNDNEIVAEKNIEDETIKMKQVAEVKKQKNRPIINEYKKSVVSKNTTVATASNKTKTVICNSTPQPIEICITQTIKCNGQPSTISTCSTLEPDHEGKLHYKTHDKIGKNCTMSIDEITIKTISTGETIVLNANSKPSTAQDFFKSITSQKKGDVVAGVFHENCDNNEDCGLRFDNNFGELILQ